MLKICILFNLICAVLCQNSTVQLSPTATTKTTYPMHIQKQFKKLIMKPKLPYGPGDRHRAPYHPAWMDYCDPYHCNDYHKEACGLNRKTMKFRYFQSGCHLIMNNMCANYRGFLKYDIVENKYCRVYVMFLRMKCPSDCLGESADPVCAYSTTRRHSVLFINQCSMDAANCRNNQEYEVLKLSECEKLLLQRKFHSNSAILDH